MKFKQTSNGPSTLSIGQLNTGDVFEVQGTGNVYKLGEGIAIKITNTKSNSFRQRTVTNVASYFAGKSLVRLNNLQLSASV